MSDAHGKIQQLLALEYGSGKMKLQHCLRSLLEKIVALFELEGDERRLLKRGSATALSTANG